MHITTADEPAVHQHLDPLNTLLTETVNSGASIGWIPPLDAADAENYWRSRTAEISVGSRILLLAWEGETLVGSAQLALEQRENGNHRAEVQKVMVHSAFRRRGIGRALMLALETFAIEKNRSLLFLDTRQGDPSEALYSSMGYVRAGAIPNYARSQNGDLEATVFYYKILA